MYRNAAGTAMLGVKLTVLSAVSVFCPYGVIAPLASLPNALLAIFQLIGFGDSGFFAMWQVSTRRYVPSIRVEGPPLSGRWPRRAPRRRAKTIICWNIERVTRFHVLIRFAGQTTSPLRRQEQVR
jgi:hypothetical protein